MLLPKEELCRKVGKRLREIRIEKKLTIEKLALECDIEYTQLSRIERGKINTSIYQIYKISQTLEVTMCDLFNPL